MFTVSMKGNVSTMNARYSTAREALEAYRKYETEGVKEVTVTNNLSHQIICIEDLEQHALAEPGAAESD